MNWKSKIFSKMGEYIGRDIIRNISETTEDIERWSSRNPFNAKNANYVGEDEYMKMYSRHGAKMNVPSRKPASSKLSPMRRDVSTWSESDLRQVMQSSDYRYDAHTQKKVKQYFDCKYPGTQSKDATGKPIRF